MEERKQYMKLALFQAKKAFNKDEVPVGAIIVKDGQVIARAYNSRECKNRATAHAEILAIEKANKKLGSWRLDGCELYVTLEPCAMCAGAICNARLKKVYFGAYESKGGAVESVHKILDESGLNFTVLHEGGIMESECSALIKKFFGIKRKNTEKSE